MQILTVFFVILSCVVLIVSCLPLDEQWIIGNKRLLRRPIPGNHIIKKRFINPMFNLGFGGSQGISNIRAKRSESECEKLRLCKLHASAGHNFFAAYELYFVNKENARLWDHHGRSLADCAQRYGGGCYNDY